MITTAQEYEKAQEELALLQERLLKLNRESPGAEKGLTKAGIRKLMARLHEELAIYEGNRELQASRLKAG